MARKKKPVENVKYTKRYYGKATAEQIDYAEALSLVEAFYPKKEAEAMLTVPNTIRCEQCIVSVQIENVVLIKGEFEVNPEE